MKESTKTLFRCLLAVAATAMLLATSLAYADSVHYERDLKPFFTKVIEAREDLPVVNPHLPRFSLARLKKALFKTPNQLNAVDYEKWLIKIFFNRLLGADSRFLSSRSQKALASTFEQEYPDILKHPETLNDLEAIRPLIKSLQDLGAIVQAQSESEGGYDFEALQDSPHYKWLTVVAEDLSLAQDRNLAQLGVDDRLVSEISTEPIQVLLDQVKLHFGSTKGLVEFLKLVVRDSVMLTQDRYFSMVNAKSINSQVHQANFILGAKILWLGFALRVDGTANPNLKEGDAIVSVKDSLGRELRVGDMSRRDPLGEFVDFVSSVGRKRHFEIGLFRSGKLMTLQVSSLAASEVYFEEKDVGLDLEQASPLGVKVVSLRTMAIGKLSAEVLRARLHSLNVKEGEPLVLDLRDSPGGSLDSALEILSHFLPGEKNIITTIDSEDGTVADQPIPAAYKTPISPSQVIVLVNRHTASASEVIAGALQAKGAMLVGESTYGKSELLMNTLAVFSPFRALAIKPENSVVYTFGEYLLGPEKISIKGKGLTPDVAIGNGRIKIAESKWLEVINSLVSPDSCSAALL